MIDETQHLLTIVDKDTVMLNELIAENKRLRAEQTAIALKLTHEWQQVIAWLAEDVMTSLGTVKEVELKAEGHPYFHGKMSVLRHFRELADDDEKRFTSGAPLLSELAQLRAFLSLVASAKHAWDRLGACEEEFEGDAPSACVEHRDMLDDALIRLFQAVCEHGEADENGFCVACGVKTE